MELSNESVKIADWRLFSSEEDRLPIDTITAVDVQSGGCVGRGIGSGYRHGLLVTCAIKGCIDTTGCHL